ncbi:unnamed protein product, partial [Prorocentrum cordatum]
MLYKPQTSKGGNLGDPQQLQLSVAKTTQLATDGGAKGQDEISLMEKTLTATTDPLLRKLLTDELQKKRGALRPMLSPEDLIKYASRAWKDATVRHDQATQAVLKTRENVEKAHAKERETSLILTRAEEANKVAATSLATHMGVAQAAPEATPPDKGLDSLELVGNEKEKLKELEAQLRETRSLVDGKHAE